MRPVFDTQCPEEQLGVQMRRLCLGLREDIRHHIATHGVGEDRPHEHCSCRLWLELFRGHSLPLEGGEVHAQIIRSTSWYLAREFAHVWSLFDLTHRLTDDRAPKSQMLDK